MRHASYEQARKFSPERKAAYNFGRRNETDAIENTLYAIARRVAGDLRHLAFCIPGSGARITPEESARQNRATASTLCTMTRYAIAMAVRLGNLTPEHARYTWDYVLGNEIRWQAEDAAKADASRHAA